MKGEAHEESTSDKELQATKRMLRNILLQGRIQELVMQHQMVSADNIHTGNITQRKQIVVRYLGIDRV